MEKIISHMADKEFTMRCLNLSSQEAVLRKQFVLEFCHAFGVKIGIPRSTSPSEPAVFLGFKVFTPEGLPGGEIAIGHHDGDLYYKYSAPHIQKDKASARSDKSSRDSNKIAGLIAAIKRNGEEPSLKNFLNSVPITAGVRYALSSIKHGVGTDMRISFGAASEFVKSFMGEPNVLESYRSEIESVFAEYKKKMEANTEKIINFNRYLEGGFKVVFVHLLSSYRNTPPVYVIADGTATDDESDKISLSNMRGVPDFSHDSNLEAVAMMVRTYMDGKHNGANHDNLFHVPHGDTYFDEVDIATGYQNQPWLAVLIPNKAP